MTDTALPTRMLPERSDPIPAWHWPWQALRMFVRAPLRLSGLLLMMLGCELLLQATVPLAGIVLSKLAVGALGVAGWPMLRSLDRSGRLDVRRHLLATAARWRGVFALATLGLVVPAFQTLVATWLLGDHAWRLLLLGDTGTMPAPGPVGLVLASGAVPGTLLALVAPAWLLERVPLPRAIAVGVGRVLQHGPAFALVALLGAGVVAILPQVLPMLLLLPWLSCLTYVAWRETRPA